MILTINIMQKCLRINPTHQSAQGGLSMHIHIVVSLILMHKWYWSQAIVACHNHTFIHITL